MITVDDNYPEQLANDILAQQLGLRMVPLVRRRAQNEYLTVQKITWLVVDSEPKRKREIKRKGNGQVECYNDCYY